MIEITVVFLHSLPQLARKTRPLLLVIVGCLFTKCILLITILALRKINFNNVALQSDPYLYNKSEMRARLAKPEAGKGTHTCCKKRWKGGSYSPIFRNRPKTCPRELLLSTTTCAALQYRCPCNCLLSGPLGYTQDALSPSFHLQCDAVAENLRSQTAHLDTQVPSNPGGNGAHHISQLDRRHALLQKGTTPTCLRQPHVPYNL